MARNLFIKFSSRPWELRFHFRNTLDRIYLYRLLLKNILFTESVWSLKMREQAQSLTFGSLCLPSFQGEVVLQQLHVVDDATKQRWRLSYLRCSAPKQCSDYEFVMAKLYLTCFMWLLYAYGYKFHLMYSTFPWFKLLLAVLCWFWDSPKVSLQSGGLTYVLCIDDSQCIQHKPIHQPLPSCCSLLVANDVGSCSWNGWSWKVTYIV